MVICIVLYLVAILAGSLLALLASPPAPFLAFSVTPLPLILQCSFAASLGGAIYCMRSIYIQVCVKQEWGAHWVIWYWLRPIVSFGTGAIAFIFLKAGLLVLDSGAEEVGAVYGYLALSIIAGLNVDKFMQKIESIAKSAWGIEKSNQQSRKTEKN